MAVPSKAKDVKPGDAKELPHGAVAANHTANVVAKVGAALPATAGAGAVAVARAPHLRCWHCARHDSVMACL